MNPSATYCLPQLVRGLVLLIILLGGSLRAAQAQQLVFDRAYVVSDTGYGGESWLGDIAHDAQGNVYVGGYFAGYLHCGSYHLLSHASHFDAFVAKYDADGILQWVQQAGLEGDERVRSLAVAADGSVYVAGSYRGPTQFGAFALPPGTGATNEDLFVAKLDAAGKWQWATGAAGSGDDYAMALALGPEGQLTVGGWFNGATLGLGTSQTLANQGAVGTADVFLARLSTAGSWLAAVRAGGPDSEQLTALAVDATGTTYTCGYFSGEHTQFGATTLVNATTGAPDGFVAQLTPAGAWQWATRLGGTASDGLYDLALDTSGRPYVAGYFTSPTLAVGTAAGSITLSNAAPGTSDIVVAALATDGSWRWASRAGDVGTDIGLSLGVTPTGQVRVAGQFYSPRLRVGGSELLNTCDTGESEVFMGQLDDGGNWLDGLATAGPGGKEGCRLVVGTTGDTYLTSAYWGTNPTIGATTLPSAGTYLPNILVAHVATTATLAQVVSLTPASGGAGQLVTLTGSGFVEVRSVRFNGVPAVYQVESATRLTTTVPVGATAGPIRVRTNAGTSVSATFFVTSALASVVAEPALGMQLWPNPVSATAPLQVRLPAGLPLSGPTQVIVYNGLGQLIAHTQFSGRLLTWAPTLPAGLYQLLVRPAGQPAWQQRLLAQD
ncbi:MAG: IPT/TIG domain-containing protein [Janthinobacterium lividum]